MADNSFTKNGDTKWVASVTQNTQSSKYTIPTGGKYVDKDIELTVEVKSGNVQVDTPWITGLIFTRYDNAYQVASCATTSSGYVQSDASIGDVYHIRGVNLAPTSSEYDNSFIISTELGNFTWTQDSSGNIWVE